MSLLRRYKKRHSVLVVAIILLLAYYVLRNVRAVADFATTYIAQPWHRFAGTVFGVFPFSVAEWLCALAVVGALAYLIFTIVQFIRRPKRLERVYAAFVMLLAGVFTAYTLICWLWGFGYYSYTFSELSGIEAGEVSSIELKATTIFFAQIAHAAGEEVQRDENGVYVCDEQAICEKAYELYRYLPEDLSFLEGSELRAKPLAFSYIMSYMNFTGVFFPMTGEANVNTHAPDSLLPSTVVHELAHQRGIYREQDANFVAILACMESAEADYVYSGALLAFIHLSNALRQTSYDDWVDVYAYLGDKAFGDLQANYEYWEQFQTPIADVSEGAYESFLQNQGQELGMRSYGACVDLLVAYYGERALSVNQ